MSSIAPKTSCKGESKVFPVLFSWLGNTLDSLKVPMWLKESLNGYWKEITIAGRKVITSMSSQWSIWMEFFMATTELTFQGMILIEFGEIPGKTITVRSIHSRNFCIPWIKPTRSHLSSIFMATVTRWTHFFMETLLLEKILRTQNFSRITVVEKWGKFHLDSQLFEFLKKKKHVQEWSFPKCSLRP